ncbi:MAG: choice-of-anchor D domain-containing protein [Bifidobacteriaceae bacterium]|nr:choice-of-anchor D domain-containing protein [Bifidobacteriaceae bacterium]
MESTGGVYGAGIGGGDGGAGGTITISDGVVAATGGGRGAGIGGGWFAGAGAVAISGGRVTAAAGQYGAGIGGGSGGTGGSVTVDGGTVTAQGDKAAVDDTALFSLTPALYVYWTDTAVSGADAVRHFYPADPAFAAPAAVKYALIDTAPVGSAAVADVTVAGTAGAALAGGQSAVITLGDDALAAALTGADASSWFGSSLPAGVTAQATGAANGQTITVLFAGTPTAASQAAFTVTVPASALLGGDPITATTNPDAKFAIVHSYGVSLSVAGTHTFPGLTAGYGPVAGQAVTVTNTGTGATGALNVSLSGADSAAFALSAASLGSIAASGTSSFTVAPVTGLGAGTHAATVTVSGANGITASFNVSFTVSHTYGVSLSVAGTHTFPGVVAGYNPVAAQSVTVTNTGTGATGALNVALSGADSAAFALSAASLGSIAASGSSSFTVAPVTGLGAGTYTATVTVTGANSIAASFSVSLTIALAHTYGVSVTLAGTHTFPGLVAGYGPVAAQPVTVTNTGTGATGALDVALSGADPAAFALSAASLDSITAGGTSSFTVAPATGLAAGTYTATVTVTGANSISASFGVSFTVSHTYGVSLSVAGTHTFPGLAAGYGPVDLSAQSVTVTNTGTGATGALNVALSGADPAAFALSAASLGSIAAGGTSSFTVAPVTGLGAGTYAATVTVTGANTITASFNVSFTVSHTYGVSLSVAGTHTFPGLAAGYGPVAAQSVTVTNTGTGATGALNVALSGSDPAAFALSAASLGSIAAGGTSSFTVAPVTGLGAGTYTATVAVTGQRGIALGFNVSFTVSRAAQAALAITGLGASYTYGDGPFTVATEGGSGDGAVSFASSDPLVATVSGDQVSVVGAGSFRLTATKAAAGDYGSAQVTSAVVNVAEATPAVALTAQGAGAGQTVVLTATVSRAGVGAVPSGTVTFKRDGSVVGTVALDASGTASLAVIAPDGLEHSYAAAYPGEAGRYNPADWTIAHAVAKATQAALAISDPGALAYGDDGFTLAASGGSGSGAVRFSAPVGNGVLAVAADGAATITGAGTVTVTAVKAGDSSFNPAAAVLAVTVGPREIAQVDVAVLGGPFVYTSSAWRPAVAVADGAVVITAADYTTGYGVNVGAGAGSVSLTGQGNYTGVKTVAFNIEPRPLTGAAVALAGGPFVETGSPITPDVTRVVVDGIVAETDQFDVAYADNVAPGTATVTVTARLGSNFTGSASASFTINPAPGPAVYRVVEHFGAWAGEGGASAKVEADAARLVGLTRAGALVDPAHYTVATNSDGHLTLTLSRDHLLGLAEGDHEYRAEFTDGRSESIALTVNPATGGQPTPSPTPSPAPAAGLPLTGSVGSELVLWAALVSLAAGLSLIRRSRRCRATGRG